MTTSRMIVVLRSELGRQLSRAQKETDNLVGKYQKDPNEKNKKEMELSVKIQSRLREAIHVLGTLQLGDIVDSEV